jgi:integrase
MGLCKDGYYRVSLTYDGKQYRITGKSEKEALDKRAELKAALKRGEEKIDGSMTVGAWSKEWLDAYVRPKIRKPGAPKSKESMTQKSYEMYEQKLNGYILPAIKNLKLRDVRDVHLKKILNAEAGRSKSNVSKIRIVIKAMFRQAYDSRLIPFDPSSSLQLPAVTEGKRRSLTDDERALLLRTCEVHRCGLWIKTLLSTGIRPGESAALTTGDFDFNSKLLTINKDIESGSGKLSDPKTKAGFRKVPIPDDLIPELQAAFEDREPDAIAFPQLNGTMKTDTCITNDWRSFKRCMEVIGGCFTIWRGRLMSIANDGVITTSQGRIPEVDTDGFDGHVVADDLILYDLRHTYCTDLQRAGVPINIASYLMGHADIQTTAKIYTHTGDEEAQTAAVSINAYRISKNGEKVKQEVKIV